MAKAPLKLVKQLKRRWATYYYRHATDRETDYVPHPGACSTIRNAIRAAAPRLVEDESGTSEFEKVVVWDRLTGVAAVHVRKGPGGLQVRYGSGFPLFVSKKRAA